MVIPDYNQVYEAFCREYFDRNESYVGVQDAFEWWLDPREKCAKKGSRCRKICSHCLHISRMNRIINDLPI